MTTTTPSTNGIRYPVFMPNQVLTDHDLNDLVSYLDNQEHLTRTYLIGMGIVCGMEISVADAQDSIQITAGCGLTSEGSLIHLAETTLAYYQELTSASEQVPEQLFFGEFAEDKTYKVVELFKQSALNRQPINQGVLTDQVLVVVYEQQDQQQDLCFLDADNRGVNRSFNWRFFLLPRSSTDGKLSAEDLLRQGYRIDNLPDKWKVLSTDQIFQARSTFFRDYMPKVYRFGYTEYVQGSFKTALVRLNDITDYETFLQRYYDICLNAIEGTGEIKGIGAAFPELFRLFSPFFSSFQPASENDFKEIGILLKTKLNSIVPAYIREAGSESSPVETEKASAQFALQYFYDYLSILVAAYQELAEAAFDLMDDALPDTQRFPRFLMLGPVVPNSTGEAWIPSAYRSHFTQPPIYKSNHQRIQRVRHLYGRLRLLCQEESFNLNPNFFYWLFALPRVTPGKDSANPLSEQAIPYYLDYQSLYSYWNFDAYRKGISPLQPAYYALNAAGNPIYRPLKEDLIYRLDPYDFYRIEGHIGKNFPFLLFLFLMYRFWGGFNLAFDVVPLYLPRQNESGGVRKGPLGIDQYSQYSIIFSDFALLHPGMEPLGGVPKGGTFIVVFAHILDILNSEDDSLRDIEGVRELLNLTPKTLFAMDAANPIDTIPNDLILKLINLKPEVLPIIIWINFISQNDLFAYVSVADFCLPYSYDELLKRQLEKMGETNTPMPG